MGVTRHPGRETVPHATRAGDVLADRYRLVDLLSESGGGRFWRAHDRVLERHVALHVIPVDDPRAGLLVDAARRSATVLDQRILRVLDVDQVGRFCYVVNEWGNGASLDIMLSSNGPLSPRRGAWLVGEVADSIAIAHAHGVSHGLLSPENVLLDHTGSVRIIGFCVDAALHGLAPGDPARDVVDLAGLLEATLTGRWAGVSSSAVPRVPEVHGRLMRPRQVRAGVPRVLDDLCDDLLNPRGQRTRDLRDLASARAVHSVLAEYVGDAAGVGESIAAGNPEKQETVSLPAVPEIMARPHPDDRPAAPAPAPAPEPEPEPELVDTAGSELPMTQAGLPIFDDETDDVSWLRTRDEPPPPPPPFEEPPERPLFATEPRKPRHGVAELGTVVPRGDEYWPFDHGRSTGSGLIPTTDDTPYDDHVPGRSFLRLAMLVAVALVLVVAVAIAFNLGRGRTPLGATPEDATPSATPTPSSSPSANAAPVALTGITATDFDPEGRNGAEDPAGAENVLDDDPDTGWTTSTYFQQLGPGGLKKGVGVLLDLGRSRNVREVDVTTGSGGLTGVSLYITAEAPTTVKGLEPVKELSAAGPSISSLKPAVAGRYVVVWLTSLPPVSGGFKGEILDVVVKA
jgi:hypothetical protein